MTRTLKVGPAMAGGEGQNGPCPRIAIPNLVVEHEFDRNPSLKFELAPTPATAETVPKRRKQIELRGRSLERSPPFRIDA